MRRATRCLHGLCFPAGLAVFLLLGGCGLAGTAASTATGAATEAEQARQAQQVEQKVQKDIEAAQQKAAEQRAEGEKQAE